MNSITMNYFKESASKRSIISIKPLEDALLTLFASDCKSHKDIKVIVTGTVWMVARL